MPMGYDVLLGDVFLSFNQSEYVNISTVSHEIGHAIGLAHPHDGYLSVGDGYYPFDDDINNSYTVLSYDSSTTNEPDSPMSFDIIAAELLYGGSNHNMGDDIYEFDLSIYGHADSEDYYLRTSLIDDGGYDSISFTGENELSDGIYFDFADDSWSSFTGYHDPYNYENLSITDDENPENLYGELYLSSGTLIEEVRTTNFSDFVYDHRDHETTMYLNGGDDYAQIYGGNDTVYGGEGSDFLTPTIEPANISDLYVYAEGLLMIRQQFIMAILFLQTYLA